MLRVTALPTPFPTTNPTRACSPVTAAGSWRCTTSVLVPARRPRRTAAPKPAADVNRCRRSSTRTTQTAGDRRSDREPVAALATPGRQDRPAGAGAHPQAEAVRLVATTVVRLERTLAHGDFSEGVRWSSLLAEPVLASHRRAGPRRASAGVRGHATPADTRFDSPTVRVAAGQGQTDANPGSPDRTRARQTLADNGLVACGQPLDPQVALLLACA